MKLSDTEVRLLGLSAPQLMKLLTEREERLLNKLYGELKNGRLEQTAALIEFATIRDLKNDITTALRRHEAQEEKVHAAATDNTDTDGGPAR